MDVVSYNQFVMITVFIKEDVWLRSGISLSTRELWNCLFLCNFIVSWICKMESNGVVPLSGITAGQYLFLYICIWVRQEEICQYQTLHYATLQALNFNFIHGSLCRAIHKPIGEQRCHCLISIIFPFKHHFISLSIKVITAPTWISSHFISFSTSAWLSSMNSSCWTTSEKCFWEKSSAACIRSRQLWVSAKSRMPRQLEGSSWLSRKSQHALFTPGNIKIEWQMHTYRIDSNRHVNQHLFRLKPVH